MTADLTVRTTTPGKSPHEHGIRRAHSPLMLWTIFAVVMILWLLGMALSYSLGGFLHILLIVAIMAMLVRIFQGRSPVS